MTATMSQMQPLRKSYTNSIHFTSKLMIQLLILTFTFELQLQTEFLYYV